MTIGYFTDIRYVNDAELKLPQSILNKAIKKGNEYGWKKEDVLEVIETARKLGLATIGGQVQYVLPQGTCELYWLSYDSSDRRRGERWSDYSDRSALECSEKFIKISALDIEKDLKASFHLEEALYEKVELSDHQVFILYFADN